MSNIAILLCTYNGSEFLPTQLGSIATQSLDDHTIWASDDGSTDDTKQILRKYAADRGTSALKVKQGPRRGVAANFLSLINSPDIEARYYAFCDQDDIWSPAKLERALSYLRDAPVGIPALYCSRTQLIDRHGRVIGTSPVWRRPFSFRNALVQNVAGGNTMVFNDAARRLMKTPEGLIVGMHDWWAYLVVSGCGGRIYYDDQAMVQYRQHGGNVLGSNRSVFARLDRLRMIRDGRFREWNDQNADALRGIQDRLTSANREVFRAFSAARKKRLLGRLLGVRRSGVYRQTMLGNAGLLAAAVFDRL